ncbi:MAG: hypothetical protein PHX20_00220 [Candidatus Omnitrophica bacterium]|nr:hypothetical protein [Candidatus Omnitrophota bacterium]
MVRLRIFYVTLAAWMVLWGWFLIRDIFVKGGIKHYKVLITRPFEGKRSYVTGDRLYEFLAFSRANLPPDSSFSIVGLKEGDVERVRAAYYLYPRLETDDPQYVLVYDAPDIEREGYYQIAKLDGSRYILKKRKMM